MTIHYHGTPITPRSVLHTLTGKHFCVSFGRPDDMKTCLLIGQSVMGDNGAWRFFNQDRKAGREASDRSWNPYYEWVERHYRPGDWYVIPDVIDGGTQWQDALITEWPFRHIGAPVWHMDEPINRLLKLCDDWPRVCIGSTSEYIKVGSAAWHRRMTEAFNTLMVGRRFIPNLHMLRGMSLCGDIYPFASVDSTDVAQNHHLSHNSAIKMASKWDAQQCANGWSHRATQADLYEGSGNAAAPGGCGSSG